MTLSMTTKRTTQSASLLLAIFATLFYQPVSTHALGTISTLPTLADFSKAVQNGDAKMLQGVYVDDLFALPVVQQPSGSPAFVSPKDHEITQFGMPARYGNIGLLAHNNLSGRFFSKLAIGQQVRLIYGDGRVESFVITEVFRYQALKPNSPYSSFRNLERNEETLTAQQVFERAYLGDRHLTLQTCIKAYGNASWGRLFVMAEPVAESFSLDRLKTENYR